MELYIIRHAQPMYHSIDNTDKGRILADEGLAQAVKIGKQLKRLGIKPELILTSPYRRTLETAHLIAEYSETKSLQQEHWISPGMSPDTALSELSAYKDFHTIVLVGHQPDLSYLIEKLDGNQAEVNVPVASIHHFSGDLIPDGGDIRELTLT